MHTVFDTSAVVPLLFVEPHSEAADRLAHSLNPLSLASFDKEMRRGAEELGLSLAC